jgi:hypothetical protein
MDIMGKAVCNPEDFIVLLEFEKIVNHSEDY